MDLVDRLLLTPSGITRLLSGLEAAGYVERSACTTDARVVYARLTDGGLEKLREARETHLAGIHSLFLGRFSAHEQRTLSDLLARLPREARDETVCDTDEAS